jgi:hypothetical protein
MKNIDRLKSVTDGRPKYRLSNANVFTSPSGYHYIDYLDQVEDISPEIDDTSLTDEMVIYIEKSPYSNFGRFNKQSSLVGNYLSSIGKFFFLDVGCITSYNLTLASCLVVSRWNRLTGSLFKVVTAYCGRVV